MAVCNFKVKTVSKKELLLWFRDNISPNLPSFEELGKGVDFCLGVEMLFPGSIGNRILELTETTEYSKRVNFRRLQTAFNSLNVKVVIPTDGLIKGSFKDIFAFGSWFKAFFEANCKSQPEDLDKARESSMKKWLKRKRQYESHKTKLCLKESRRANSDGNASTSQNNGDCDDSVDANSENNFVLNTGNCEDVPGLDTSLELLSTEESNDSVAAAKCLTPDPTTNKVRAFYLKKWMKTELACESYKSQLHLDDTKHPSSDGKASPLPNKGDSDSVDSSPENNTVSNTEICKDDLNTPLDTPAELLPIAESDDVDQTTYISEEIFADEKVWESLKSNEISHEEMSNDAQMFTGDSDVDPDILFGESRTETTGNASWHCLTNTEKEGNFATDMNVSSLSESSLEKLVPSAMLSEKINIELENYNIHLKESLEKLNDKYNILCRAVNEVRKTLTEISVNPTITDEPTEDQFCYVKLCCQRITKLLNDINL